MLTIASSGSNGDDIDGEKASGCNSDKLGRKYLCIRATSCVSQRSFSTSDNTVILQVKLH